MTSEDISGFITEYTANYRVITKITTYKFQEYDPRRVVEQDYETQCCWEITDNIRTLLAHNPELNIVRDESKDVKTDLTVISNALQQHKLITLRYWDKLEFSEKDANICGDHYMSCIGFQDANMTNVLLIQSPPDNVISPERPIDFQILKLEDFLQEYELIMTGESPDWFYKSKYEFTTQIEVYDRKPVSKRRVLDHVLMGHDDLTKLNAIILKNQLNVIISFK